jgi:hypothetical protein
MTQFDRQSRLDRAKELEYETKLQQQRFLNRKRVPNASPEVLSMLDANVERKALLDSAANMGTGQGSAAARAADMMARERTAANDYRRNLTTATQGSQVAVAAQPQRDSDAQERMRTLVEAGAGIQNNESIASTKRRDLETGAKVATLNESVEDRRAFRPGEVRQLELGNEGMGLENQALGQGNERRAMMLDLVPDEVAAQRAAFQRNRERSDAEAIAIANAPPRLSPEDRKANAEADFAESNVDAAKRASQSGVEGMTPEQAIKRRDQRQALLELNNIDAERRTRANEALKGIASQMSSLQRGKIAGSSFTGSGDASLELADQLSNYLDDLEALAASGGPGAEEAANEARKILEGMPAPDDSGGYGLSVPIAATFTPLAIPAAVNASTREKAAKKLTETRQRADRIKNRKRQLPPEPGA